MPERIQLKRTKGWRIPANAVKVDRSTRWGNPWKVGNFGPWGRTAVDAASAVAIFEAMLGDPELRAGTRYPNDLSELRGKNLACWCPLDQPCHADVLLRLANAQRPGESFNEYIARLVAENAELAVALRDHNDALRSAYNIAERRGENTNWDSFFPRVKRALETGHSASNLARIIAPQNQDM